MKMKTKKIEKSSRDASKTRQILLEAANAEFYRKGFQAASLDNILDSAGVTKGALYYHFENKLELGYAVVEEIIKPQLQKTWIEPVETADNPITALIELLAYYKENASSMRCQHGCPLNNLAQEMSPVDDEFRVKLLGVFDEWQARLSTTFEKGKKNGQISSSVNSDNAAAFVVAVIEGVSGLAKSSQNATIYSRVGHEFVRYLESLRQ